jgi:hypothetical protein
MKFTPIEGASKIGQEKNLNESHHNGSLNIYSTLFQNHTFQSAVQSSAGKSLFSIGLGSIDSRSIYHQANPTNVEVLFFRCLVPMIVAHQCGTFGTRPPLTQVHPCAPAPPTLSSRLGSGMLGRPGPTVTRAAEPYRQIAYPESR